MNDSHRLGCAVFLERKVLGGRIRERLAVPIDDRDIDADQVCLRAEGRRLRRLGRLRGDAGDSGGDAASFISLVHFDF